MIKAVFDTNTIISGLLWTGLPHCLLELVEKGRIELCASVEILDELEVTLKYERFQPRIKILNINVSELLESISELVSIYSSGIKVKVVEQDPDDDIFFSCALASGAKYIVSGDHHLLNLRSFENIQILSPRDFYEQIWMMYAKDRHWKQICGGRVITQKVQVDYRWKGELTIIENVPAGVCQQCGEEYYTGKVAEGMEQLVKLKRVMKTIPVPVKEYKEAVAV